MALWEHKPALGWIGYLDGLRTSSFKQGPIMIKFYGGANDGV